MDRTAALGHLAAAAAWLILALLGPAGLRPVVIGAAVLSLAAAYRYARPESGR